MTKEAKISAGEVKDLREKTGAGMMDCKRALEECGGDVEKAVLLLRDKGMASAKKREERSADQGVIDAYLHIGNQIGSLVELNCETDFVARNSEFLELAHLIALHVAACNPRFLDNDSVPEEIVAFEKEQYRAECETMDKAESETEKIVEERILKFYQEACLLEQPFVKDPSRSVGELLTEAAGRLGEKLAVRRFVRFQVGEKEGRLQ